MDTGAAKKWTQVQSVSVRDKRDETEQKEKSESSDLPEFEYPSRLLLRFVNCIT